MRQLLPKLMMNLGHQLHGEEGMASEIEEAILDSDWPMLENAFPDLCELKLDNSSRGGETCLHFGTVTVRRCVTFETLGGLDEISDRRGRPLDNNVAERALKRTAQLPKNTLFYKNEHGAMVGEILLT